MWVGEAECGGEWCVAWQMGSGGYYVWMIIGILLRDVGDVVGCVF